MCDFINNYNCLLFNSEFLDLLYLNFNRFNNLVENMNLLKKAFFKGFNKKKSFISQRRDRLKDFLIPTYPQNLPNYNDSKILDFTNGSSKAAHLFKLFKIIKKEFKLLGFNVEKVSGYTPAEVFLGFSRLNNSYSLRVLTQFFK